MPEKGMFTELMEPSNEQPEQSRPPKARSGQPQAPDPAADHLPPELANPSRPGYNAHSYRFSAAEIRWLRRFSVRASEVLDRNISRNSMIRVLLRLAEAEWN